MKGTPQFAMCGNSQRALDALRRAGAPVTAVDILPDPEIRQELSALSGWPTVPQVFVKGELIGGADIVQELAETGELERKLTDALGAFDPRELDRLLWEERQLVEYDAFIYPVEDLPLLRARMARRRRGGTLKRDEWVREFTRENARLRRTILRDL